MPGYSARSNRVGTLNTNASNDDLCTISGRKSHREKLEKEKKVVELKESPQTTSIFKNISKIFKEDMS